MSRLQTLRELDAAGPNNLCKVERAELERLEKDAAYRLPMTRAHTLMVARLEGIALGLCFLADEGEHDGRVVAMAVATEQRRIAEILRAALNPPGAS